MQVWPFLLVTIGLLVGVGYMIANTEKAVVMQNWPQMRCSVPILFAASFFKPSGDKRSSGEFAMDNFEFCMKSLVHEVMEIVMAPLFAIFGKHVSMAEVMSDAMNGVRKIMHTIYEAFLSFIDPFLKKYTAVAYQVGIVTQHMRMAFQRVNAMMLGMLFTGLTMIRGFMNAIDFVIKVVMIIVGIMVALIIILFFILFPFIPLILSVLAAVVAVAIGSVAASASASRGAFCFPAEAHVVLENGTRRPICEIRVGDVLWNGATVEATMLFDGKGCELWELDGICVAGSHRVRHAALGWPLVEQDPRARRTSAEASLLYCLTTSDRKIPIYSPTRGVVLWFRDWEELEDGDEEMEAEWNRLVLSILNDRPASSFAQEGADVHLLGRGVRVITANGARRIVEIRLGDFVLGENLELTRVTGIVEGRKGEGEAGTEELSRWWSGCLVQQEGVWERVSTTPAVQEGAQGRHLLTESGTFVVIAPDTGKLTPVRDYTEVGIQRLPYTYPFVEERIRNCAL
jgi:hypothetical protein